MSPQSLDEDSDSASNSGSMAYAGEGSLGYPLAQESRDAQTAAAITIRKALCAPNETIQRLHSALKVTQTTTLSLDRS